jgi:hypothetical protein
MALPNPIPLCPGYHPNPPALPATARPPVLRHVHQQAQRELPLYPRR